MSQTRTPVDLASRIAEKRSQVQTFIAGAVPRKRRLLNLTILAGTLAAALTAGPAAGGASFTGWLTKVLGLTAPSWQLLCGLASVCSLTASVSTQLLKSQQIEEHVVRAQNCLAKLEVLEIGLAAGDIDSARATTEYARCVEETSFL